MKTPSTPRREFLRAATVAALVGGGLRPVRAAADPARIALVIGNDRYSGTPLVNAGNDARAVSALLDLAGFTVFLQTDTDRQALRQAAMTFAAAARGDAARLVFFYYAGHGAQVDWRNYLLPVDARVATAGDLPSQCLDLGTLLAEFARAKGKTFVVILDACRDNPFGDAYRPAQKGLSQFDAPPGTLIAFSTAPGSVAADGTGGSNGLYTGHLVRELSVRDAKLEDALKRVRLAVRVASRGAQVPWESTSLESDVFLFPAGKTKLSEAELEADYQREIALWNRVKVSKEPDDWVGYLREYPGGKFSEIAQNRLAYLLRVEEQRLVASKPPVVAEPSAVVAAPPPPAAASPAPALPPAIAAAAPSPPAVGARAQLEIGPGFPARVLMRPSQNPASAGTYVNAKTFTVGDEVVYAVSDAMLGRAPELLVQRVTLIDEENDRVEINGGESVFDTLGNLLKWGQRVYDPRAQREPAQLQVGNKWTTRFRLAFGGRVSDSYFDHRVAARESVRVPAGEFDSFRLEGIGYNMTADIQISLVVWVVPGLNFPLRSERIAQPRAARRDTELRELVSCRQMRWSVA